MGRMMPALPVDELRGGRWREASTGVDRRAQLEQVDHVGDRHGLVLDAKCSVVPVRAVVGGAPTGRGAAVRPVPGRERGGRPVCRAGRGQLPA